MAENKVKFGLDDVYIAKELETDVYDTPFRLPGAVNLNLDPNGSENSFYADNQIYYQTYANQGYTGELEIATITEQFDKEIMGVEEEEDTFIHIEKRDAITNRFALSFRIKGDKYARRYWAYGCTCSRPSTEAGTTGESEEPQTDTLSLTIAGLDNGCVRIRSTEKTPESVLLNWNEKVRFPGDGLGE